MNKKELIAAVAEKSGLNLRTTEKAITAFTEVVVEEVANKGRVKMIDFGTFEARFRVGRIGKDPRNGQAIKIESNTIPVFKAGKAFRKIVSDKNSK